ncbi:hypothetical protein A3SI_04497 [Nitritalea halalkaliphila LW7]|uniref:Lipocalin-like domain-containing protein n=1 Tax=Nitritalea halalkaliphila LW7 TaxID=1189621 RepID=I5C8A2_9BACT|nr:lipocalin family protein [Nitritalea halalkaliphila]EIM78054.1 hypothetical protein A3SI_04497 [Nitritalea halalkaliphila LW7]
MKEVMSNVLILLLGTSLVYGMVSQEVKSSESIVGVWKEVAWEYEKLPTVRDQELNYDLLDTRELLGQQVIIHQGETWEFNPDGTMKIYLKDGDVEKTNYTIKRRGDLLRIQHGDDLFEAYEIRELSDERMVIHFHADVFARGIVKLTFERI